MTDKAAFEWNLGDIFDAVGDAVEPGRPALVHEEPHYLLVGAQCKLQQPGEKPYRPRCEAR